MTYGSVPGNGFVQVEQTRVTAVKEASSTGSRPAGTGAWPTLSSAAAAGVIGARTSCAFRRATDRAFSFGRRRLALESQPEGDHDPLRLPEPVPGSARRRRRAASTKVGSLSRTSACCGMFERLRSATHSSRLGASKASMAGCGKERCHQVYMPRRYSFGPAVGQVLPRREVEVLPVTVGLVGIHAGAADLRDEQTADGQGVIAYLLGFQPAAALAGQFAVVRIARSGLRRGLRDLPVGLAGDDQADHVLDIPAAVHELDRRASRATPG